MIEITAKAECIEREAKRDKVIARAKEELDYYFTEEEREVAYAMFIDALERNYPFVPECIPCDLLTITPDKLSGIIKENYGSVLTDRVNAYLSVTGVIEVLVDEFPDRFNITK